MGGRRRRMIKATVTLMALGYCGLLTYQLFNFSLQENGPVALQVPVVSFEPVTKTNIGEQTVNTTLDAVFISVKTTRHYQYTRLPIILKTWFQLAKQQTWFFTDIDNEQHQLVTNGHMVNTKCSSSHQRKHLCCKMSVEYDYFLESNKKWFCHFDDDNYVNTPQLIDLLQKYSHREDWYLGRTSVYEPVTIYNKQTNKVKATFWFATGGAGFCISRSLALKMLPVASGGKFISICEDIRLPDDVTIGYIIEHLLKKNLTVVPKFHSHFEQMKLLDKETFREEISFSYGKVKNQWNVVDIPGFSTNMDPTRFLSLHCYLFPNTNYCRK